MTEKNGKYEGKTIKVACDLYPENWLEFRADITQRQYNRYTIHPTAEEIHLSYAARLDKEVGDLTDQEKTAAEVEAAKQQTETITAILRDIVIDGVLMVDGQEVRGIDAILEADFEGVTMPVANFWGSAFFQATAEAFRLGKPVRLN